MAEPGDINRDGKIDNQDLELLRAMVRNTPLFENLSDEEKVLLDVNRDGEVNYDDVIRLIEMIKSKVDQDHSEQGETLRRSISSLRNKLRSAP